MNSLIACVAGLIIPIALGLPLSVNQTFASGPAAIPSGMLVEGRLNSLIACVVGLIIPTALVVPGSLNHMLPSVPIAIDRTALPGFRPLVNLVTVPPVVIWPTAPFRSLNHRFPSGPATTWAGLVSGAGNSVICPIGAAPAIPTHVASPAQISAVAHEPIVAAPCRCSRQRLPERGQSGPCS